MMNDLCSNSLITERLTSTICKKKRLSVDAPPATFVVKFLRPKVPLFRPVCDVMTSFCDVP